MEGASAAPNPDPRCPSCGTPFLGFREHTPCPSCRRPADGTCDIVAVALRTYTANHRAYGQAIPPVIHIQSPWDDYLYRGLFFLKALDDRAPHESEEAVVDRTLDAVAATTGPRWRAHLESYCQEVLKARNRASEREK